MTMEDVKALEARGHDIGSHGMTHANLGKVPEGLDIPAYQAWLARERITVLNLPTAFWHEWVRELEERAIQPPRAVGRHRVGRVDLGCAVGECE